ncbi:MAG: phosphotransacetylase family protein [Dehalococcoidia bacterium]|nr:phosphotransacetylase family protein [Dehalococcoidia bacterium]
MPRERLAAQVYSISMETLPMTTLFVAGYKELAGKTTICAAVGKQLQALGIRTDYIRVADSADGDSSQNAAFDQDFISRALSPTMSASAADNPPVLPQIGGVEDFVATLKGSSTLPNDGAVTSVTLIELPGALDQSTLPAIMLTVRDLDARIMIVVKYRQKLSAQELVSLIGQNVERVVGVILNGVPRKLFARSSAALLSSFEGAGLNVLAILPEDRVLCGFTIGQMAEELGAEYLCLPEKADVLIENLMLGANAADPAYTYFSPKPNKAVFCRSDRPDIQLAALDTETRCLVLTGLGRYQQSLVYRAEDLGVAVLRVPSDTYSTIMALHGIFQKVKFRQVEKVTRAVGLLSEAGGVARLVQLVLSSGVSPSS